ncbi:potassium-transporting ATPase KdpC subunit [Mycolicibacterium insubricum]|jgi:K+-transporting ATPase ATPase C chain|uniref:Potassium-transporting ATPase KdpC subunit n=1 Tax=Mycolicibacterium insubricum TaxID=444597 RepID=A0A1X0DL12_9MYCO|nr:potassium-transporting ATPase subunit C [Mycolicibacterium insubricum]MCB9441991.1 potassium-transporting ATPase subunit C [Mycolicibacterium sp.]MCV7083572.1 potassium-transporting ATPase subunit C [Mycolicibacterium insubricum]ORA73078.1 K+-transporting ATPase subunit C [Mycolicibacterium insubricum]BBZ68481.1 potassium-transporting ATPase KdpC subunit [Mycolicibacterium insubricum]
MSVVNLIRLHWAALRALVVLTVVLGLVYPLLIWLIAQLPGLRAKAEGSIVTAGGKPVGSSLIGQSFTDGRGVPLARYFQGRPSAAGSGYDAMSSGASNLGPESIVDTPSRPSLLTEVCDRSRTVGGFDSIDGTRPFCTPGGVGAVLSVIGPRDARGEVTRPTRVISVNEPCPAAPFLAEYRGVRVECASAGDEYRSGLLVTIRGDAPQNPAVPADAVTASASGLDPDISPAYAQLQVSRVAAARNVGTEDIAALVRRHTEGPDLRVFGQPRVNVLELNLDLDANYPVPGA